MGYHLPTREKLKMQVLRGYPGNGTGNLSTVAFAAEGQTIFSGMIVQLSAENKVEVGLTDPAKPAYVAYHDSSDGDAKEAGLVLFDLAGNYEFQVSYFDSAEAYPDGTPLTANSDGEVIPLTDAATEARIGFASRPQANSCVKNLLGQNSGAKDLNVLTFVASWSPVIA